MNIEKSLWTSDTTIKMHISKWVSTLVPKAQQLLIDKSQQTMNMESQPQLKSLLSKEASQIPTRVLSILVRRDLQEKVTFQMLQTNKFKKNLISHRIKKEKRIKGRLTAAMSTWGSNKKKYIPSPKAHLKISISKRETSIISIEITCS